MHRAWAAVLLAILFWGSAAPITCAGWESAPSERMACCKRAAHGHAGDQGVADDCCAGQEQTHQSGPTVAVSIVASPPPVHALFAAQFDLRIIAARADVLFEASLAARFHSPPHPSGSPLRI